MAIHGERQGAPVRLSSLPDHVVQAFLAVEDRNFYHHFGINPISILRAAVVNTRHGSVVQGGSTITQQLAKNLFLNADRTMKRKSQELILALWLEFKFSKNEILTLYLNRVYFGGGAYGIDAAGYRYFGKPARTLSLAEAAVLAGILKAPSRFAPSANPVDAGRRGRLALDRMVSAGYISQARAVAATAAPIRLADADADIAPYVIDYTLSEIRRLIGRTDLDLIVRTTFDPQLQRDVERGTIAGRALVGAKVEDAQHAAIVLDGGGAVRALIGGRDYRESQFNRAVQARRQLGSSFKPIVYLAALDAGLDGATQVDDAPITLGNWSPANYNDKYFGATSLSYALAHSMNSASIRLQEYVGRTRVRSTARRLGWAGDLTRGPSLALGVDATSPIALAGLYAPFMNGGYRVTPHIIQRIETADGDLLYENTVTYVDQVIDGPQRTELNTMLSGVVEFGTGRAAAIPGHRIAGKTGTTQNYRDAWFAGYAGELICVVWVGNDDNSPMHRVTGGGAPAIMWREIMQRALPTPQLSFSTPVEQVQ